MYLIVSYCDCDICKYFVVNLIQVQLIILLTKTAFAYIYTYKKQWY